MSVQHHALAALLPKEITWSLLWTESWVEPTNDGEVLEKRKVSCAHQEPEPDCKACTLATVPTELSRNCFLSLIWLVTCTGWFFFLHLALLLSSSHSPVLLDSGSLILDSGSLIHLSIFFQPPAIQESKSRHFVYLPHPAFLFHFFRKHFSVFFGNASLFQR